MIHAEGELNESHAGPRTSTDKTLDADWQVKADGSNKFVFNTEAHPFKIAG